MRREAHRPIALLFWVPTVPRLAIQASTMQATVRYRMAQVTKAGNARDDTACQYTSEACADTGIGRADTHSALVRAHVHVCPIDQSYPTRHTLEIYPVGEVVSVTDTTGHERTEVCGDAPVTCGACRQGQPGAGRSGSGTLLSPSRVRRLCVQSANAERCVASRFAIAFCFEEI